MDIIDIPSDEILLSQAKDVWRALKSEAADLEKDIASLQERIQCQQAQLDVNLKMQARLAGKSRRTGKPVTIEPRQKRKWTRRTPTPAQQAERDRLVAQTDFAADDAADDGAELRQHH